MTKILVLVLASAYCAAATGQEWTELRSEEGNFKLLLPGKATCYELKTPDGDILHNCKLAIKNGSIVVSYGDIESPPIKDTAANKVLEDTRDAILKHANGKLVMDSKVSVKSYPGRDYVIAMNDKGHKSFLACRNVLVKNRLIQIVLVQTDEQVPDETKKRIFESLDFLSKPASDRK